MKSLSNLARSTLRGPSRRQAVLRYRQQNFSSSPITADTSAWKRPVQEGDIPAYDEALKFLQDHSRLLLERAAALESKVAQAKDDHERTSLADEIRKLRVEARINDPKLRWEFSNASMSAESADEPALRELAERHWRKNGVLDRLMQRVTQMNVVPDLIPAIEPTVDLAVKYGVEAGPGDFLLPSETVAAPSVSVQSFHEGDAPSLYTLIMVDPDSPSPETSSFSEYCHWIVPNIPISASTRELPLSELRALLPYQPPHPSSQTPYHRYTLLLIRQAGQISIEAPPRQNFNLRLWLEENGFDHPSDSVQGIFMFREGGKGFGKGLKEVGTREAIAAAEKEKAVVQKIYEEELKSEMPEYVKAPKFMRYGTLTA